jgi:hypothetical protein
LTPFFYLTYPHYPSTAPHPLFAAAVLGRASLGHHYVEYCTRVIAE